MTDHALLGPQYRRPNLRECLESLGIHGPLVSITAGWQEREGEIEELHAHVAMPVTDLGLYTRAEHVHAADPTLAAASRERQDRLQELQDLYRVRLAALMGAVSELAVEPGVSPALRRARLSALGDVRRLDRQHLLATQREHSSFVRHWQPARRPSLSWHLEALRAAIERAAAVLVAGGHVAVLLNRLRLFGIATLVRGKPLIAWSAGAMAVSDRVVLFHDRPPQGAAHAEVLESGLGLVPGVVLLPHAHVRLALDDAVRVREFARRFAPAKCLTLEHGSFIRWHRGRLIAARDIRRLARSGRVADVQA
jgi:peptidase S51-like protein